MRSRAIHAFGGSYLIYTTGAALVFLQQMLLTHTMGQSQFGIFAYVASWLSMLALFQKQQRKTTRAPRLEPACLTRMKTPHLVFVPTRNFLPSERQPVFRSVSLPLVKTNLCVIILSPGETCGLDR